MWVSHSAGEYPDHWAMRQLSLSLAEVVSLVINSHWSSDLNFGLPHLRQVP